MIQVVISRQKGEYSAGVLRPSQRYGNHDSCADNKLLTPKQFSILSRAAPSHQRLFVGEQEPSPLSPPPPATETCHTEAVYSFHWWVVTLCVLVFVCVCVWQGGWRQRQESLSLSCLFGRSRLFLRQTWPPCSPTAPMSLLFLSFLHAHTPSPHQHLCCFSLKMSPISVAL